MMERFRSGEIGRAAADVDLHMLSAQVDRARRELRGLARMLEGATEERLAGSGLLSRAEAIRARAANQLSAGAHRATDTAREHPLSGGLVAVAIIGLVALLLSRR